MSVDRPTGIMPLGIRGFYPRGLIEPLRARRHPHGWTPVLHRYVEVCVERMLLDELILEPESWIRAPARSGRERG